MIKNLTAYNSTYAPLKRAHSCKPLGLFIIHVFACFVGIIPLYIV